MQVPMAEEPIRAGGNTSKDLIDRLKPKASQPPSAAEMVRLDKVDLGSADAFPALASSASDNSQLAKTGSGWYTPGALSGGAAALSVRARSNSSSKHSGTGSASGAIAVVERLEIPSKSIMVFPTNIINIPGEIRGCYGTHSSLLSSPLQQPKSFGAASVKTPGELAKEIQKKTGTMIELSTSSKTGNLSVIIRGSADAVKQAKREIQASLCIQTTISMNVPASVRPHIMVCTAGRLTLLLGQEWKQSQVFDSQDTYQNQRSKGGAFAYFF